MGEKPASNKSERINARPQNVWKDEYGNKVIGMTSSEQSAIRNGAMAPGQSLLDRRAGWGVEQLYRRNAGQLPTGGEVPEEGGGTQRKKGPGRVVKLQGLDAFYAMNPYSNPRGPTKFEAAVAAAKEAGKFDGIRAKFLEEHPDMVMGDDGRTRKKTSEELGAERQGRVAAAKQEGKYNGIRDQFHAQNPLQVMDDQGNIRDKTADELQVEREVRVSEAKYEGKFDGIRQKFQNENLRRVMDEEGNIRDKTAHELEDDRQGYVMMAKSDGSFDAKREAFNKAQSNQWMNEDGRLVSRAVDGMGPAKEGTQVHDTALGKMEVDAKGTRTLHTPYGTVAATATVPGGQANSTTASSPALGSGPAVPKAPVPQPAVVPAPGGKPAASPLPTPAPTAPPVGGAKVAGTSAGQTSLHTNQYGQTSYAAKGAASPAADLERLRQKPGGNAAAMV